VIVGFVTVGVNVGVNVGTTVNVSSSPSNPVHTHVTEFGNVNISGTSLPVTLSNTITVIAEESSGNR
jgi:hypothetical protein